ncbi:spermidine synthase [Caerostris extrusa]|uniref:Spermidine synthase n=1 Tax=Caerostris extrusa TaxID=172846 RepID=A0AAV4WAT9_CAEEX|nr:spermidine synthase [Caerostris extrusa]
MIIYTNTFDFSPCWGKVLVLDDAIQLSQFDEYSWQEMASFISLNSHPNPKSLNNQKDKRNSLPKRLQAMSLAKGYTTKYLFAFVSKLTKVLIIGGGVGGVIREVSKHPLVESVAICELDKVVYEASQKFLPFMAKGFNNSKYKLYFADGAQFVKNHQNEFDVIITDSPDPKGVAACLFENSYYKSLQKALKPDGIIISQGETFWYDKKLVSDMIKMCKTIFPVVDYAVSYVATYPAGQIGYLCCSNSPKTNFRVPLHKFSHETLKEFNLKYYTPDTHRAAFALPLSVAEELGVKWEVK